MKWKEIILSGAITLFVTIVSGLLIFYVTRESPPRSEEIVFYIENSATFSSDQGQVRFLTITVRNSGVKAAHDVRIGADLEGKAVIQDKKISLSSGPVAVFHDQSTEKKLSISIDNFSPTETGKISLLVKGDGQLPSVGVQSQDSIGIRIDPSSVLDNRNNGLKSIVVPILFVVGALALQLILGKFAPPILRKILNKYVPTRPNLNNTAFLYLQQGLTLEAENLLNNSITQRGADAITLANYALALGLREETEAAGKRFAAADWWARQSHEKAVIQFNRATLHLRKARSPRASNI